MRLDLRIAGFRLGISLGPDTDDATDPGPGAAVVLDQQGPYGFAPPDYWTDDPDEWRHR